MSDVSSALSAPAEANNLGGSVLSLAREHDSRLAVIVGSGPSLRAFDLSQLNQSWIFPIVINDERERAEGVFTPGAWVFNDWTYYKKLIERCYSPPQDGAITVVSRDVSNAIVQGHCDLIPSLVGCAKIYESSPRQWDPSRGLFLVRKTTATAALCLAHLMGFKSAALLGVDLFFESDRYYHTDESRPSRRRDRSMIPIGDGIFQDDWQIQMMDDLTRWKILRDKYMTRMDVSQCSVMSPLTCFPKRTWQQVVAGLNVAAAPI